MFGRQGNADRVNAKMFDDTGEYGAGSAIAQQPSADLSAEHLTIEDFVTVIGEIVNQLDLLNATVGLAGAVEIDLEFTMIADEVRILAREIRLAAVGVAAAVTASGTISGEVAAALTGIKNTVQHINELMANAAATDIATRHGSLSLSRLCN
jgi:methyl-accepting chemotaxis protein